MKFRIIILLLSPSTQSACNFIEREKRVCVQTIASQSFGYVQPETVHTTKAHTVCSHSVTGGLHVTIGELPTKLERKMRLIQVVSCCKNVGHNIIALIVSHRRYTQTQNKVRFKSARDGSLNWSVWTSTSPGVCSTPFQLISTKREVLL